MIGKRVDILGVRVSAVNMPMAAESIAAWVESRTPHYVCVTGVHGVMESQRDPELLRIHNESGMTTPDGMPLVWAGHRAGADWMERVYGPDLMLAVLESGLGRGWRHFFYGGGPGVADTLSDRLRDRFDGLLVCGTHCPPFRPLTSSEMDEAARMIDDSGADIVWVGLSTPKQERLMARLVGMVAKAQLIGVGAAFDMHAGLLRQAPSWMQRSGMEWAFRLGVEPRRLWKRYARNNPAFVMRILREPPRLVKST